MTETEDAGLVDLIGLIEAFLQEPLPSGTKRRPMGGVTLKVQDLAAGKALLALEPARRVEAAIDVLLRLAETSRTGTAAPGSYERRERLKSLADRLLRGKLPVDAERMARLVEAAGRLSRYYLMSYGPVGQL